MSALNLPAEMIESPIAPDARAPDANWLSESSWYRGQKHGIVNNGK